MKKILTAAVLGLAVMAGAAPLPEAPAAQVARASWKMAGPFHSSEAAYHATRRLQAAGYETRIMKRNGYWYVYYR